MSILISGSIAFDHIFSFTGRFADSILPQQIDKLSVCFVVPHMRSEYGGCAGNIAYAVKQLGGNPLPLATVGKDGSSYLERLQKMQIETRHITVLPDCYTAQCTIVTDAQQNQITTFHPGAMDWAHTVSAPVNEPIVLGIVAPNGKHGMQLHAAQMHAANIPFIFDPGQNIPFFSPEELQQLIDQACWLTLNDYEAYLLCERLGYDRAALSKQVRALFVTLGENGCEIWQDGNCQHIEPAKPSRICDPTGCGDAWRGALLHGLQQGWDLPRCARLGNYMGALKISHHGPQSYQVNLSDIATY